MGTRKQQQRAGAIPLFPSEIRQRGTALFEQQMWCWGCDVRRESGNLLLTHGMEKRPAPEPRFHSGYSCALESGGVLTLWGWGLWAARPDCGSVFMSRSRFCARCSDVVELRPVAWSETSLPPVGAPQTDASRHRALHLLSAAFHWIAAYEGWLLGVAGAEYRERALAAWPQRRRYRGGVPVDDVAGQWTQLAQMTASMARPENHHNPHTL